MMKDFYAANHSVFRTPLLQKMFIFIGVGEKVGCDADSILRGGDCPKTHKLESANFQFATDDSTFSQLRSCFDSVCRIKQQNHDTTVSD